MIPKFRARDQRGNWHIGLLTFMFGQYAIVNEADENTVYLIDKETIGQSTGLKDKNGVEIFEGDVLYYIPFESHINNSIIVFEKGSFCTKMLRNGKLTSVRFIDSEEYEVIGNIHENPELLEVAE
ncbi:YopX family protein [Enterococcus faecalis]|uniref:YopX family protein n=1 Tax=Enterococcus faecalis TaxID=1351 RepID=UPI0021C9088F|nr:YopX family protein [Enterococcus faecalis]MCU2211454.1 YopX family protein [Enterococcus faecalis]